MLNPESQAPSDFEHPLYALVGPDVVPLDGHMERGVMAVLAEAARQRGVNLSKERPTRLFNDPADPEIYDEVRRNFDEARQEVLKGSAKIDELLKELKS